MWKDDLRLLNSKQRRTIFWLYCMKHLWMELDGLECKRNSWINVSGWSRNRQT